MKIQVSTFMILTTAYLAAYSTGAAAAQQDDSIIASAAVADQAMETAGRGGGGAAPQRSAPQRSTPQPQRSAPQRPVQQPQRPIQQPQRPVQQPQRPVQQPQRPIQQPQRPIQQPQRPIQQPQRPIERPISRPDQIRDPIVFHGGDYSWPRWDHPDFVRPVYDWDWATLRLVTCTAEDSTGNQYPVTEDGYVGMMYEEQLSNIEDAALDRCFSESGGDTSCVLLGCNPGY